MLIPKLPIDQTLPGLITALRAGSAVLAAPPGSGKTTVVPLALLAEPWLANRNIIILEPRRLAARAAAGRMASLLAEKIGQTVGYQVRFDRQISQSTRIEVLTEGILTRRIQNDPDLNGVGLIIFDEFHERSIHADLALALCLDLCQLKEDLRLLVMSATLDTAPISRLLGNVPVIIGEGQSHEVRIDYLKRQASGRISETTSRGIRQVVQEQPGDILAFLPGAGEIREVQQQLNDDPALRDMLISPLFGNLTQKEQDMAIMPDPAGRRRLILATSIAETSLTIEGISCVVDSGWSRRPRFDPANGLSTLATVRVSKAAADQRTGRAGRLGPGHCLRLWTRGEQHGLIPFHPPEIVTADLASLALELSLWGAGNLQALRWIDPPRPGPFRQAMELLQSLGALDTAGRVTATGRQLAFLPIHPRLGQMLLQAAKAGRAPLACDIAAILTERDPIRSDTRCRSADLRLRLSLLESYRKRGQEAVIRDGGDPGACKRIDQAAREWLRLVSDRNVPCGADASGNLLVYAYPDRIARRRPHERDRYLLANGRGAVLPASDPMSASEYLVVAHLDAGQTEGRIFLAESLHLTDLKTHQPQLFSESRQVYWDDASARVCSTRRLCLGEIIVEEKPLTDADPAEISRVLMEGVQRLGLQCLPWNRESQQFQARMQFLRNWQPEIAWPDLTTDRLQRNLDWLEPYLGGISRAEQLKSLDLLAIFKAMLSWEMQQLLELNAPTSMMVASGSKIRIDYRIDEQPLLAVRIQEMFGQRETPAICGGRVPLLLHLLSPARRPVQLTSDLAGFWQRSYPEVKKELKGRYPKHFWPDDPLAAEATRGVKRK